MSFFSSFFSMNLSLIFFFFQHNADPPEWIIWVNLLNHLHLCALLLKNQVICCWSTHWKNVFPSTSAQPKIQHYCCKTEKMDALVFFVNNFHFCARTFKEWWNDKHNDELHKEVAIFYKRPQSSRSWNFLKKNCMSIKIGLGDVFQPSDNPISLQKAPVPNKLWNWYFHLKLSMKKSKHILFSRMNHLDTPS